MDSFSEKYPELHEYLLKYKVEDFPVFYHATRLSSAKYILKQGFKTEKYGTIHGEQDSHPQEKTTYFSRNHSSNNLNSTLFDTDEQIVILKVDATFFNKEKMYPDDGMFDAWNLELLFFDVEDMSSELNLPIKHCQAFFDDAEAASDLEIPELFKPFAGWYLHEHGEISITHDIPSKAILDVVDYQTGVSLKQKLMKKKSTPSIK